MRRIRLASVTLVLALLVSRTCLAVPRCWNTLKAIPGAADAYTDVALNLSNIIESKYYNHRAFDRIRVIAERELDNEIDKLFVAKPFVANERQLLVIGIKKAGLFNYRRALDARSEAEQRAEFGKVPRRDKSIASDTSKNPKPPRVPDVLMTRPDLVVGNSSTSEEELGEHEAFTQLVIAVLKSKNDERLKNDQWRSAKWTINASSSGIEVAGMSLTQRELKMILPIERPVLRPEIRPKLLVP